jgi:hypothetical protein
MRVYDCDNQEEYSELENLVNNKDLISNNSIQSFAPDTIAEANNRGFKSF